jgi:MerR family transcriptional regulator, copper efflux regulator
MKIGEAAAMSGVTVKAIRHYEARGLLDPLARRGKYRRFSPSDVERLRLIAHCRGLGLGIAEIKRVVSLVAASKPECPPPDAMLELVEAKLRGVRSKIRELQRTETQLATTHNYLEQRRHLTLPLGQTSG